MQTLPFSPAAERNKQPILEQLQRLLPAHGLALEIGAGSGQHAAHFVAGLPGWHWQPSELEPAKLAGLQALRATLAPALTQRLLAPQLLDVSAAAWPLQGRCFDLIYSANMLHVAPWACCAALMQGAARHLAPQGLLLTYGPYLEDTVATAPSNLDFDADLRARDPAWGLRRLEDVQAEAERAGLQLLQRVAMPANNLLLVWGVKPARHPG